MGTGRMADIGAPCGEVLVSAVAAMSLGGLVGRGGHGLVAATSGRPHRRCRRLTRRSVACAGAPCPPRRARLRRRHQPPGAARRLRRTRRTAPRWSPSAPTGTASRGSPAPSRPASRPSCTRSADSTTRGDWDADADRDRSRRFEPDLVVLAGFMKLVGPEFLGRFAGRVVNTHPALCPSFPGMSGPADALAYGVKVTGATLFVVDAGVDTGPIVAQTVVPVEDDDDVESLHERIKVAERTDARRHRGPDRPRRLHHHRQEGADRRMTEPEPTPSSHRTASRSGGPWSPSTTRPASRTSSAACTRPASSSSPPAARPR